MLKYAIEAVALHAMNVDTKFYMRVCAAHNMDPRDTTTDEMAILYTDTMRTQLMPGPLPRRHLGRAILKAWAQNAVYPAEDGDLAPVGVAINMTMMEKALEKWEKNHGAMRGTRPDRMQLPKAINEGCAFEVYLDAGKRLHVMPLSIPLFMERFGQVAQVEDFTDVVKVVASYMRDGYTIADARLKYAYAKCWVARTYIQVGGIWGMTWQHADGILLKPCHNTLNVPPCDIVVYDGTRVASSTYNVQCRTAAFSHNSHETANYTTYLKAALEEPHESDDIPYIYAAARVGWLKLVHWQRDPIDGTMISCFVWNDPSVPPEPKVVATP